MLRFKTKAGLQTYMVFILAMLLLANTVSAAFKYSMENDSIIKQKDAPAIIPLPQQFSRPSLDKAETTYFQLTAKTPILLEGAVKDLLTVQQRNEMRQYFRNRLLTLGGQKFELPMLEANKMKGMDKGKINGRNAVAGIVFRLAKDQLAAKTVNHQAKGAYTLEVTPGQVIISAQDKSGFFYGLVSLLQLGLHEKPLAGHKQVINIPCWKIKDQANYGWRGLMLDESRHFFGKQHVKQLLDWMAYYKLNYFHWHLTDEPGWRLEIKAYPKLTTIGAIGNKTDSTAPPKFYTQQEIREIVRYAEARGITVIPEIDMPGHGTAANRAYPENSGGGVGKYANFTFNPGATNTYRFLTNILRETNGLFNADFVHLGGDEVSFGNSGWKDLPAVKQLMARENLKDNKAVEAYFLKRMQDSALQFNKKIMTWDEGVAAGLRPDKTIICWWRQDKTDVLASALAGGYDIVMCPRIPLYFDFVQDSTHKVGRRWAGKYASLRQVFEFNPKHYTRQVDKKGRILGMQANLWTETVQTEKRLEFMLFPRMAALAEAAWTKPAVKQFNQFESTLQQELHLYNKAGLYYFNPFAPASTPEPVK